MNMKDEGITFSVLQSWFIVATFVVLVLVVAYNGYSADQRSKLASEERRQQINLSKIIIQDIDRVSPEEEKKLASELRQVFEKGIPTLEKLNNKTHQMIDGQTMVLNDMFQSRQLEHKNQTDLIIQGLKETGNATAQAGAIVEITEIKKMLQQVLNSTR